jgi:dTDP-4-amino-4,6-dideoxygalactose transaminase
MPSSDIISLRDDDRYVSFASPDVGDDDVAAVVRVLRSGWLTTGDECRAFEEELGAYLGIESVAVSSCTAALEIAFAWLGLPPGARVGVPTWTFVSTALAPARFGAQIVLLDVDADTLNVSPRSLEQALEAGLDAVVPVHLGGVPVDEEVHRLCAAAGVPVVEDAAHALGATDHRGRLAGHGSVAACFSFYATKNLTTGEGGALATDDPDLVLFARSYRQHGLSRDAWARYRPDGEALYDLVAPGIKANLPDLLAALGRTQLARFDELQRQRRALVERYRSNLATSALEFVPAEHVARSADHLAVVLLPEGAPRAAVVQKLGEASISSSVHFQPLHQFKWFAENAQIGPSGIDVAERLAVRAMSLPLHPGLSMDDVDRVCEAIAGAVPT